MNAKHRTFKTGICVYVIFENVRSRKLKERKKDFSVGVLKAAGVCDSFANIVEPSTTHFRCLS